MLRTYQRLQQSGLAVFDRKAVANILDIAFSTTNSTLDRLVRAGILTRLKRDRYVLTETAAGQTRKIANELVKPSALSLWTVLSDGGLTTQVPRAVQSVTSKRPGVIEHNDFPAFQYVHLPMPLFFDVRPDAEGVLRVSAEKALLDLLFVQAGAIDLASLDLRRLDREKARRMAAAYPKRVATALAHSPFAG